MRILLWVLLSTFSALIFSESTSDDLTEYVNSKEFAETITGELDSVRRLGAPNAESFAAPLKRMASSFSSKITNVWKGAMAKYKKMLEIGYARHAADGMSVDDLEQTIRNGLMGTSTMWLSGGMKRSLDWYSDFCVRNQYFHLLRKTDERFVPLSREAASAAETAKKAGLNAAQAARLKTGEEEAARLAAQGGARKVVGETEELNSAETVVARREADKVGNDAIDAKAAEEEAAKAAAARTP
ncbi:hypothetical protein CCR75_009014 [Bremia lactucae]|uniref:RxLR effector protein n=1 Tax=Bremia lactucae TaxID=4779 RepID=A0A976IFY9_BRELC|nr:hypothetical protein CCR75_009014 [Bremia lactucae]